jgi:hypothetical protein
MERGKEPMYFGSNSYLVEAYLTVDKQEWGKTYV